MMKSLQLHHSNPHCASKEKLVGGNVKYLCHLYLLLPTSVVFFETTYLDFHHCPTHFIRTETCDGVEVTEARNGDGADAVGLS